MSSVFASLDEAFNGPANPGKTKKKRSAVPGALGGSPDPDRPAEIPPVDPMGLPKHDVGSGHPEAAAALQDFFPLPGETASSEQWSNAFMLEGSQIPSPVNGKSTLWRKIEKPVVTPSTVVPTATAAQDSDVYKRLDMLTKQLEELTQVHPMQSTAELFLFVAIGLIFLLAIDTLLRFATTLAVGRRMRGGGGGRLLNRRWFK